MANEEGRKILDLVRSGKIDYSLGSSSPAMPNMGVTFLPPGDRYQEVPEGTGFTKPEYTGEVSPPSDTRLANLGKLGGQFYQSPSAIGRIIRTTKEVDPEAKRIYREGLPSSMFEVAHRIPQWLGGASEPENLELLPRREHDKATAVEAVVRELLRNPSRTKAELGREISPREAIVYTTNWRGKDVSGIPMTDSGGFDIDAKTKEEADDKAFRLAVKKFKEWEATPSTLPKFSISNVMKAIKGEEGAPSGLDLVKSLNPFADSVSRKTIGDFSLDVLKNVTSLGSKTLRRKMYGDEPDSVREAADTLGKEWAEKSSELANEGKFVKAWGSEAARSGLSALSSMFPFSTVGGAVPMYEATGRAADADYGSTRFVGGLTGGTLGMFAFAGLFNAWKARILGNVAKLEGPIGKMAARMSKVKPPIKGATDLASLTEPMKLGGGKAVAEAILKKAPGWWATMPSRFVHNIPMFVLMGQTSEFPEEEELNNRMKRIVTDLFLSGFSAAIPGGFIPKKATGLKGAWGPGAMWMLTTSLFAAEGQKPADAATNGLIFTAFHMGMGQDPSKLVNPVREAAIRVMRPYTKTPIVPKAMEFPEVTPEMRTRISEIKARTNLTPEQKQLEISAIDPNELLPETLEKIREIDANKDLTASEKAAEIMKIAPRPGVEGIELVQEQIRMELEDALKQIHGSKLTDAEKQREVAKVITSARVRLLFAEDPWAIARGLDRYSRETFHDLEGMEWGQTEAQKAAEAQNKVLEAERVAKEGVAVTEPTEVPISETKTVPTEETQRELTVKMTEGELEANKSTPAVVTVSPEPTKGVGDIYGTKATEPSVLTLPTGTQMRIELPTDTANAVRKIGATAVEAKVTVVPDGENLTVKTEITKSAVERAPELEAKAEARAVSDEIRRTVSENARLQSEPKITPDALHEGIAAADRVTADRIRMLSDAAGEAMGTERASVRKAKLEAAFEGAGIRKPSKARMDILAKKGGMDAGEVIDLIVKGEPERVPAKSVDAGLRRVTVIPERKPTYVSTSRRATAEGAERINVGRVSGVPGAELSSFPLERRGERIVPSELPGKGTVESVLDRWRKSEAARVLAKSRVGEGNLYDRLVRAIDGLSSARGKSKNALKADINTIPKAMSDSELAASLTKLVDDYNSGKGDARWRKAVEDAIGDMGREYDLRVSSLEKLADSGALDQAGVERLNRLESGIDMIDKAGGMRPKDTGTDIQREATAIMNTAATPITKDRAVELAVKNKVAAKILGMGKGEKESDLKARVTEATANPLGERQPNTVAYKGRPIPETAKPGKSERVTVPQREMPEIAKTRPDDVITEASEQTKYERGLLAENDNTFISLDIETRITGDKVDIDHPDFSVLEMGLVKMKLDGTVVEKLDIPIRQEKPINQETKDWYVKEKVARPITDEYLDKSGYEERTAAEKASKFIGNLPVVGVNSFAFDIPVVNRLFLRNNLPGIPLEKSIDIGVIFKGAKGEYLKSKAEAGEGKEYTRRVREMKVKGLTWGAEALSERFNEPIVDYHRGVSDAEFEGRLLGRVLDMADQMAAGKLEEFRKLPTKAEGEGAIKAWVSRETGKMEANMESQAKDVSSDLFPEIKDYAEAVEVAVQGELDRNLGHVRGLRNRVYDERTVGGWRTVDMGNKMSVAELGEFGKAMDAEMDNLAKRASDFVDRTVREEIDRRNADESDVEFATDVEEVPSYNDPASEEAFEWWRQWRERTPNLSAEEATKRLWKIRRLYLYNDAGVLEDNYLRYEPDLNPEAGGVLEDNYLRYEPDLNPEAAKAKDAFDLWWSSESKSKGDVAKVLDSTGMIPKESRTIDIANDPLLLEKAWIRLFVDKEITVNPLMWETRRGLKPKGGERNKFWKVMERTSRDFADKLEEAYGPQLSEAEAKYDRLLDKVLRGTASKDLSDVFDAFITKGDREATARNMAGLRNDFISLYAFGESSKLSALADPEATTKSGKRFEQVLLDESGYKPPRPKPASEPFGRGQLEQRGSLRGDILSDLKKSSENKKLPIGTREASKTLLDGITGKLDVEDVKEYPNLAKLTDSFSKPLPAPVAEKLFGYMGNVVRLDKAQAQAFMLTDIVLVDGRRAIEAGKLPEGADPELIEIQDQVRSAVAAARARIGKEPIVYWSVEPNQTVKEGSVNVSNIVRAVRLMKPDRIGGQILKIFPEIDTVVGRESLRNYLVTKDPSHLSRWPEVEDYVERVREDYMKTTSQKEEEALAEQRMSDKDWDKDTPEDYDLPEGVSKEDFDEMVRELEELAIPETQMGEVVEGPMEPWTVYAMKMGAFSDPLVMDTAKSTGRFVESEAGRAIGEQMLSTLESTGGVAKAEKALEEKAKYERETEEERQKKYDEMLVEESELDAKSKGAVGLTDAVDILRKLGYDTRTDEGKARIAARSNVDIPGAEGEALKVFAESERMRQTLHNLKGKIRGALGKPGFGKPLEGQDSAVGTAELTKEADRVLGMIFPESLGTPEGKVALNAYRATGDLSELDRYPNVRKFLELKDSGSKNTIADPTYSGLEDKYDFVLDLIREVKSSEGKAKATGASVEGMEEAYSNLEKARREYLNLPREERMAKTKRAETLKRNMAKAETYLGVDRVNQDEVKAKADELIKSFDGKLPERVEGTGIFKYNAKVKEVKMEWAINELKKKPGKRTVDYAVLAELNMRVLEMRGESGISEELPSLKYSESIKKALEAMNRKTPD